MFSAALAARCNAAVTDIPFSLHYFSVPAVAVALLVVPGPAARVAVVVLDAVVVVEATAVPQAVTAVAAALDLL